MLKLSTAIGSMPYSNEKIATKIMSENLGIPVWPQLPKRNFKENMYVQYSEGFPCLVVDEKNQKIYFNIKDNTLPGLEKFYEKIIADDLEYFKISSEYAAGLYEFISLLSTSHFPLPAVKGQITGPITFGLKVTDQDNRSIFYNEQFSDVVVKALTMKARWQIRKLRTSATQIGGQVDSALSVIMFIDEPYLSSFGSAFTQVSREDVIKYLSEVSDGIHSENALSGVHCCGNTDWSILMDTNIDIISFDAYSCFDGLTLYPDKLNMFLQRGGILAWGIVPSSDAINTETISSVTSNFTNKMEYLVKKGINEKAVRSQYLITPSCGVGSLPEELAKKIIIFTKNLAENIIKL
ncbi:MAG: methionine synthase [Elusimicrobia bacterium]|nr:methionine synthase [Elusimicrobiota bacterium]